jgi:Bacterial Ig-like domain
MRRREDGSEGQLNTRLRLLVDRAHAHPVLARAIAAIVLLVLVAPLVMDPTSAPLPSGSPASSPVAAGSSTPASPNPSAEPGPSATPEPWDDLQLGPIALMADVKPKREDSVGVATTSSFTVRSLGAIPAVELAAGILTEPPVEFRIRKGASPAEAILDPIEPLLEAQTYRFRLVAPDGSLGGTWAFRTQRPLQVVHTLPGDATDEVPVDTGIQVTFDQDGTTAFEPHFRIEPEVAGRFEAHGRTWAFVPDVPLAAATAYRVTIEPGVEVTGSKQVLETAVSFRFETVAQVAVPEAQVDFAGPMAGARVGEHPSLLVHVRARRASMPATLPVRIYRLRAWPRRSLPPSASPGRITGCAPPGRASSRPRDWSESPDSTPR